jgi:hypothetical protein
MSASLTAQVTTETDGVAVVGFDDALLGIRQVAHSRMRLLALAQSRTAFFCFE